MDKATREAERLLREILKENRALAGLEEENAVICRLLNAQTLMRPVYAELAKKLSRLEHRREVLIQLVIAAAYYPIDRIEHIRCQLREAARLNDQIAQKAREIVELISLRESSCPDVCLPGDDHPVEMIERAADYCDPHSEYLFGSHVKRPLAILRHRFDGKYWPKTIHLLTALADVNEFSNVEPISDIEFNATRSRKKSPRDFFRALFESLDLLSISLSAQGFPSNFKLTNEALAAYAEAATGHPFDAEQAKKKHVVKDDSGRKI